MLKIKHDNTYKCNVKYIKTKLSKNLKLKFKLIKIKKVHFVYLCAYL